MVDQFLNGTADSGTGHPIPEPDSFIARFRNQARFSIRTKHIYISYVRPFGPGWAPPRKCAARKRKGSEVTRGRHNREEIK